MKKLLAILIPVVLIILLIVPTVSTYNSLVAEDQNVQSAFSKIDTVLQRRNDLIPNLVNTAKGYATHEKEIFTALAAARASVQNANTPDQKVEANNNLSGVLTRFMAVVENYPDLKANANFAELMNQLEGTENRIAQERRKYNDVVQTYNTKIKRFPTNIFAGMFSFKEKAYFKAAEGSEKAPVVDFNK